MTRRVRRLENDLTQDRRVPEPAEGVENSRCQPSASEWDVILIGADLQAQDNGWLNYDAATAAELASHACRQLQ